jgi:phage protein D
MIRANRNQPLVPAIRVTLNKAVLAKDVAGWIVNATVEDDLNEPGMFSVELVSRDDERGTRPWTDDELFDLGGIVRIAFGYGEHTETLLAGEITALEPSFGLGGPPSLVVRGYDRRHRLNKFRRTRTFVAQKDSEIATTICSEAGLDVRAVDSGVQHDYVLQPGQTDLDFLLERARRIHFELAMDEETVLFRPVANAQDEVMSLSFEDDLLDFDARLSLIPATQVVLRAWDPQNKQALQAVGEEQDEEVPMAGNASARSISAGVLGDRIEDLSVPVASQAEADGIARGHYDAMTLDLVTGEGRCRGCTGLRAGKVILLEQLGQRFSGLYYVTSAVHSYSRRTGYITTFRVRRNAS